MNSYKLAARSTTTNALSCGFFYWPDQHFIHRSGGEVKSGERNGVTVHLAASRFDFFDALTKCGYEPFRPLTLTSLFHQCLVNSPSIHSFHIHDVLWQTDIVFFLQMSTDTLATSGNHCCFGEKNVM